MVLHRVWGWGHGGSFPDNSVGKESTCNTEDLVRFLAWERLPTPVFWPRELNGLYSRGGQKESDAD